MNEPRRDRGPGVTELPRDVGRSRRLRVLPVALLGAVALLILLVFAGAPGRVSPPAAGATLQWRAIPAPDGGFRPASLVAAGDGFALLGTPDVEGSTLWSIRRGDEWLGTPLQMNPMGITVDGDRLIMFRDYRATIARSTPDGWTVDAEIELPTFVRSGYLSTRPGLVALAGELFAHSVDGELYHLDADGSSTVVVNRGRWWAPQPDPWQRFTAPLQRNACRPPFEGSLDYPPLLAASGEFVALVPLEISGPNLTYPVCDPQVWHSPDGLQWIGPDDGGFDSGDYIYDVASSGSRVLAVGGAGASQPALWSSLDGRTWTRLSWPESGEPYALSAVAGGDLGFVIVGRSAAGSNIRAWYSSDGTCWVALPESMAPAAVAVGTDQLLVADSRPGAPIWAGSPSGAGTALCDIETERLR